MEETIELRELFAILFKRKWFILIVTIIFLGFGVFYSKFMVTPMYESSTTLMVNGSKGMDASDIAGGFDLYSFSYGGELVVTYSEIVKSRIVLEQVIEQLQLDMPYEQVLGMTAATQVGTTEILNISVTDTDPNRAEKIANKISSVFIKEVMRILKVDNVEIIDAAIPMPYPINIRTTMNIAISTILGMMLAVFLSFVIHYLDRSVKTEEDIENYLGLTVLGTIPDYTKEMKKMGV